MRTRLIAAPLLGLAALLAACGSGAASPAAVPVSPAAVPATAAPATEAPATEAAATEAPSAAGGDAVAVTLATTSLGDILVDGKGMTLYVFTPDNAGDSTCYDDCEQAWPVLAGGSVTAGEGLAAADFGATTRTDGSTQITFNGWPLYYFAGDSAPGDVNGQGLNGVWWVIDASGNAIGA